MKWYTPCAEQAGSQPNRACEEQVFTLLLYIDIAGKSKIHLYILFVDYVKAYDKVNRQTYYRRSVNMAMETRLPRRLAASLSDTTNMIGKD